MDYHEAIAALGMGSAHPGGFSITREWMKQIEIQKNAKILEVGCGTGRTACALQQHFNCNVVGVDRNEKMIAKAHQRAATLDLPIQFSLVRGSRLPFTDALFDVVVAESVTVFNDLDSLLNEYQRVLKPKGFVINVEMCANSPLPADVFQAFHETYGAECVPTMSQWKDYYHKAGFHSVRIIRSGPVPNSPVFDQEPDHMSPILTDKDAYTNDVYTIMNQNQIVMQKYAKWLNFAVIQALK